VYAPAKEEMAPFLRVEVEAGLQTCERLPCPLYIWHATFQSATSLTAADPREKYARKVVDNALRSSPKTQQWIGAYTFVVWLSAFLWHTFLVRSADVLFDTTAILDLLTGVIPSVGDFCVEGLPDLTA